MKHYCYRCDVEGADEQLQRRLYDIGRFHLERCYVCEREQCMEYSGMYKCENCSTSAYYCMDCKESTHSRCSNRICSDCDICLAVKNTALIAPTNLLLNFFLHALNVTKSLATLIKCTLEVPQKILPHLAKREEEANGRSAK